MSVRNCVRDLHAGVLSVELAHLTRVVLSKCAELNCRLMPCSYSWSGKCSSRPFIQESLVCIWNGSILLVRSARGQSVGTYNRLILTTGHLSAQMSSGQDEAVIFSNKRCVRATPTAVTRSVRSPAVLAPRHVSSRAHRRQSLYRTAQRDLNRSHLITRTTASCWAQSAPGQSASDSPILLSL
jgi:hypothetical protein